MPWSPRTTDACTARSGLWLYDKPRRRMETPTNTQHKKARRLDMALPVSALFLFLSCELFTVLTAAVIFRFLFLKALLSLCSSLRVCYVCRWVPLKAQVLESTPRSFLRFLHRSLHIPPAPPPLSVCVACQPSISISPPTLRAPEYRTTPTPQRCVTDSQSVSEYATMHACILVCVC